MERIVLPKPVLDLLAEVAPDTPLRIARGDGADEVADEVNIYTALRWKDAPPVREALKNVMDHLIGGAPLDLHKVDRALEYVRVRKEDLTEEYTALLRAIAREVESLWWFAEAFESRPISERDVEAAIATLERSFEDYLEDSPTPEDVELALAVKNSIAEVLWAAQPNTPLFHLEEALREGRWALKEFWGSTP